MSPPRKPSGPRIAKARLTPRGTPVPRRLRAGVPAPAAAVNPPALGVPRGFSHGWLAPAHTRLLFVAGETATDADGRVMDEGFAAQFDRALARTLAVVEEAGGRPEHVMRMTIYVTDLEAYLQARRAIAGIWRARMGRHYPAMALVEVTRLVDAGALVEIEATAALPPA
jgi:enamine deaminase RidA (YjgF/YER057c/UK114 family)